jgi:hypothetical protein
VGFGLGFSACTDPGGWRCPTRQSNCDARSYRSGILPCVAAAPPPCSMLRRSRRPRRRHHRLLKRWLLARGQALEPGRRCAALHLTAAGGATVPFWMFTGALFGARGLVVQPAPFPCIQTSHSCPSPTITHITSLPFSNGVPARAHRCPFSNGFCTFMASVRACWDTVSGAAFYRIGARKKKTLNPPKRRHEGKNFGT